MLYEIDVFNIKATLVEPGHVRLDEPDDNIIPSNYTTAGAGPPKPKRYGHFWVKPNPSEPYNTPTSPAGHAKRMIQWLNDRQPVSAVKSAELIWQLGHCSYPPLRLLLGSYAVESVRDRLRSIIEEVCFISHSKASRPCYRLLTSSRSRIGSTCPFRWLCHLTKLALPRRANRVTTSKSKMNNKRMSDHPSRSTLAPLPDYWHAKSVSCLRALGVSERLESTLCLAYIPPLHHTSRAHLGSKTTSWNDQTRSTRIGCAKKQDYQCIPIR